VLPRCTREAIEAFVRAHSEQGVLGTFPYELKVPEYRARLARFIGASPDEIAFLRSTSGAANILALGIDWRPGDEILLCDNEFPANAVPWRGARSRGAKLRFVETARERMTPDVLRRRLTPQTRVVAVSWVSFGDGYRHPLAALAEVAHEAGAFFCVDGIQGLGVFPVDVKALGVDAFYGSGAKWLLALQGVAYLYISAAMQERVALAAPGWRSLENMWDFSTALSPIDYDRPYVGDASKFEGGTLNFLGALSIATSVDFLERNRRGEVARHVLALTDRLVDGLERTGAELLTPRSPDVSSGIVTFMPRAIDPIGLGKRLQREGIVTTYRDNGIRVSPHGYNTFEEIDALLALVP
jgi:cysteine desulfurase / selenocysteine lyase